MESHLCYAQGFLYKTLSTHVACLDNSSRFLSVSRLIFNLKKVSGNSQTQKWVDEAMIR